MWMVSFWPELCLDSRDFLPAALLGQSYGILPFGGDFLEAPPVTLE